MTDLSQQTTALLKAFDTLHRDITNLNTTNCIVGVFIVAILLIVAFRKRP